MCFYWYQVCFVEYPMSFESYLIDIHCVSTRIKSCNRYQTVFGYVSNVCVLICLGVVLIVANCVLLGINCVLLSIQCVSKPLVVGPISSLKFVSNSRISS